MLLYVLISGSEPRCREFGADAPLSETCERFNPLYCSEGLSSGGGSGGGSSGILVQLQCKTSTIVVEELRSISGRLAQHFSDFKAYDISLAKKYRFLLYVCFAIKDRKKHLVLINFGVSGNSPRGRQREREREGERER